MRSAAYAVMRCLSIRLSVTFVYYIETAKHILNFSPGRPTILLFPYEYFGEIPTGSSLR